MASKKTSVRLEQPRLLWEQAGDFVPLTPEPDAEPTPEPSGMMRRYVGDTALSLGRGAVQGVRMLSDVAGADNAVSTGLRSVEDFIGGLQSAEAKQDQAEIARILKEAEGKGVLDQVIAGARAFSVAPMQTMAQAAGTSLPTIGAALIPGVGTAAVAARFAAPLALGAAQGAGAVKSSIYDEVKQRAIQEGRSQDEAEQLAVQAQEYSSANGGQIALGAGLGAWAGKSGLEGAAHRLAHGNGGKAVPGMASRVAMGAVAEGIPEAAQGGQEKYASNVAQDRAGFATDPMSGVVAGATMEALAGAATGGAMGIPAPAESATAPLPDTGPMSRAANAARGQPLDFTPTEAPAKRDGLAMKGEPDTTALDFEADPRFAGSIAFPNGKAPAQPLFPSKQLADVHIGEQGAFGELMPVEVGGGQWSVQQTPEAANRTARANIEQWMTQAEPMEEAQAKDIAKRAESELNKPMTALPMPSGEGWTVVPRQWVTAPVLLDYTERAAAAAKILAEPVERTPRTGSTDGVEIDPASPNAVAQFIAQQATVNTPAARAFVQDYRAGRVTDADVLARINPQRPTEPTPDERIAAAAEAGKVESDSTRFGLILNRDGKPFKSEFAATREQKKHPGSQVVAVDGGHAVQAQEPAGPVSGQQEQAQAPEPQASEAAQAAADPPDAETADGPKQQPLADKSSSAAPESAIQRRNRLKADRATAGSTDETVTWRGNVLSREDAQRTLATYEAMQEETKAEIDTAERGKQRGDGDVVRAMRSKLEQRTAMATELRDAMEKDPGEAAGIRGANTEAAQAPAPAETAAHVADQEGTDSSSAGAPAAGTPGSARVETGTGGAVETAGVADKPKKLPYVSREDGEHLFGVDKKRKAAMERIAKGTAYFGTKEKARDFITSNGLKDTHEAVEVKPGRHEVREKAAGLKSGKASATNHAAPVVESGSDASTPEAAPSVDSSTNAGKLADKAPAASDESSKPKPAPKKKAAPKSFRKTHKVTTPVFMEETGEFADQEIDAETALQALDADIEALQSFRACVAGAA